MWKWCHFLSHTAGSCLFISWCTLDAVPAISCTASALVEEAVLSRTWAFPKWGMGGTKKYYGGQWIQLVLKEEAWRQWGIKTLKLSNCRGAEVAAVALHAGTAIWQATVIITFISTDTSVLIVHLPPAPRLNERGRGVSNPVTYKHFPPTMKACI